MVIVCLCVEVMLICGFSVCFVDWWLDSELRI